MAGIRRKSNRFKLNLIEKQTIIDIDRSIFNVSYRQKHQEGHKYCHLQLHSDVSY